MITETMLGPSGFTIEKSMRVLFDWLTTFFILIEGSPVRIGNLSPYLNRKHPILASLTGDLSLPRRF